MVSLKSFKLINEDETVTDFGRTQLVQTTSDSTRSSLHQEAFSDHHHHHHHHHHNQIGPQFAVTDIEPTRSSPSFNRAHLNHTDEQRDICGQDNNKRSINNEVNSTIMNQQVRQQQKQDMQSDGQDMSNSLANRRGRFEANTAIVAVTLPSRRVHDEISIQQRHNNTLSSVKEQQLGQSISPAASSSSISIVVVRHDTSRVPATTIANANTSNRIETSSSADDGYPHDESSVNQSLNDELDDASHGVQLNDVECPVVSVTPPSASSELINSTSSNFYHTKDKSSPVGQPSSIFRDNLIVYSQSEKEHQSPPGLPDINDSRLSVNTEDEHFEIVWSNLSYKIEPKWYKKFNFIDQVFSQFMPGQTVDNHSSATSTASSSAGMNDNQHQMHTSTNLDNPPLSPTNQKQKSSLDPIEIFTNLNGTIKSGQMTAVLGPSGAGKTTLLNCLTGKLKKGVSGHINLKGANGKNLKMCTIPQKDHLLELLTVEENLWFASKIKNPEYGFDHVKNIERVIDLLGLKRCRSAKIKKISGGQHKRVSIAQELLSNPDILVLDEPTSGLDSLTCFKTISMLRDLVELSANNDFMKPMAIIVTIHQPQPKVFNLFHHVYILANGGRVIYEGGPELALSTITDVTGLQPIDGSKPTSMAPGAVDPASFLIEIASEEYGADVINTLNDYQRNTFYETNCAKKILYNARHGIPDENQLSPTINRVGLGAKDNHGFSPDFDNESKSTTKKLSSVFVTNRACTKETINNNITNNRENINNYNNHERQQSKDEISDDTGITRRSPKGKKRKKSTYSLESGVSSGISSGQSVNTSQNVDTSFHETSSLYMSEQLLYTRVPNHKGRFWSHTATLTHRTLLTIRRDPLLMTSRVLFHLMIPILMGHVYGKATGAANACPHYEPEIDITQIPSLVEGKRIEYMLEELHMSIENVSMFFIIMYAFAAAVLALNALSFPLNMQVLLKETRNGWYSMSSYVLAKTLADLPLELTMPTLTMALVYPLTGQPSSYFQWRMLTICLIMTLCSLIAQTQALILGALVMNSVQTAVFISQASQLPWVILAGFTIRIKRLSEPLKLISLTSFYRLGCEAITLTRYGFGICPCDPQEITGEPVKLVGIPDQLRTVAQYWLDSMEASKVNNDTINGDNSDSSSLITTTVAPSSNNPKTDIFQHLANQLSYANSYGVNITSCDDVAPDRIRAINLGDNWLVARIWHLFIMLIIMKFLLYYAVKFSIGIRL